MEYPDRCLSAHLLSPLAIQEPEEVQQGRREMCDCWEEGFSCKDGKPDAVYGALQLAFSNDLDDLAKACASLFPHYLLQLTNIVIL